MFGVLDRIESARAAVHNRRRAEFVRRHLPKGAVGAELGVHKGFFTEVILNEARPSTLYIVDPWYMGGAEWTWGHGSRSTVDGLRRVLDLARDGLASGQVKLHIGDDLAFLSALPDQSLDWAYIDTTHAYDHTCAELTLLRTKVKPGGVVAGDDWREDPSHRHHGVCRAVREHVARHGDTLVYSSDADNQWAFKNSAR